MLAQPCETVGAARWTPFEGWVRRLPVPALHLGPAGGPTLLQSRRGSLLQRLFPGLVAAAQQLPHALVLDGEHMVVWSEDRLSFEALQRRISSGGRTVQQLADAMPGPFIAPATQTPDHEGDE